MDRNENAASIHPGNSRVGRVAMTVKVPLGLNLLNLLNDVAPLLSADGR